MRDYFHTFQFNGRFLYELGAVIAQPPTHITSMRDINFESIPGRSGDSIIDNGRYENKILQFPIRAVPAFCDLSLQDFKYKLAEWLQADDCNYEEFRDTYNPGYFRKGIVTQISEVVAVKRDVYETAITFNFEPFLYSDTGLKKITYNFNGGTQTENLFNPEQWDSEPIITVIGESPITLGIGDDELYISTSGLVDNTIIIDKSNENIYDKNGNSCNNKVNAVRLPYLKPGNNEIRVVNLNGSVTLKIIPNWRRL